jgi:hypothetical protein
MPNVLIPRGELVSLGSRGERYREQKDPSDTKYDWNGVWDRADSWVWLLVLGLHSFFCLLEYHFSFFQDLLLPGVRNLRTVFPRTLP